MTRCSERFVTVVLVGILCETSLAFTPSSRSVARTTRKPLVIRQTLPEDASEDGGLFGSNNDEGTSSANNQRLFWNATVSVGLLDKQASSSTYDTAVTKTMLIDPLIVSQGISEDIVSAVLGASEEAVAAAEALLSKDQVTIQSTQGSEILPAPLEEVQAPSVGKILKFAVPAIGVWLCSPILSLIDTSAVGILSGTTQQAALNPAVAVTDYSALLIAFLYTGTTNLIAAAREKDRLVDGSPRATASFVGAMQFSTYVGAGLGATLFLLARPLLHAIIGNASVDPAIFAAALKYVRIRALGMPAAAVIGSAQAACLGMQDIRSPLYVLGVAAGVNFLGDCLFVGSKNAWIGGAAGAAWATVFSQYAAVFMFMHWLCNKSGSQRGKVLNVSKAVMELTGKSRRGRRRFKRVRDAMRSLRFSSKSMSAMKPPGLAGDKKTGEEVNIKPKQKDFSVRGFLDGKFGSRDLLNRPSKATVDDFKLYILPVTSTQVGRVSGYVAMSHVVSSSLGYVSMAAQQVIVSLFYCLCPIADSLSLTAQSFVPAISARPASRARAAALRKTVTNFFKASGVFGAAMVAAVTCIPILSGFFTTDPAVVALVNLVTPMLVGFFAVHGFVCAGEGLLLAQKDLSFLGRLYTSFFAVVPFFMLRVKKAALAGDKAINLTSVWKVFLCYQLFRFGAWTLRVNQIQRRTERAASAIEN